MVKRLVTASSGFPLIQITTYIFYIVIEWINKLIFIVVVCGYCVGGARRAVSSGAAAGI